MEKQRKTLPLGLLFSHPKNPRKQLMIDDLTDSIVESGQLVPILVRPFKDGYQIISGHRRRAALERSGFLEAECDIMELDDEQAYTALMVTNVQSQTLSEYEEAEGIKQMVDEFGWTQERVAQEFGKSQDWVSLRLKLLGLSEPVKELLTTRVVNSTHAREIAKLPLEQQEEVAKKVVEENLSTRATAEEVKKIIHQQENITESTSGLSEGDFYSPSEQKQNMEMDDYNDLLDDEASLKNTQNKDEQPYKPREYPRHLKASNYITKFYEFLANLDKDTIDGIIELDEKDHVLAIIGKAEEQLSWMRKRILSNGETNNIVEFKKKAEGI